MHAKARDAEPHNKATFSGSHTIDALVGVLEHQGRWGEERIPARQQAAVDGRPLSLVSSRNSHPKKRERKNMVGFPVKVYHLAWEGSVLRAYKCTCI